MTQPADPRALQLAQTRHRIAHEAYGATPDWNGFNPAEKTLFVEEAAVWLRAAVEAGLIDRPPSRRDAIDQAAQEQRVTRARHEGAIEALQSAAEHMDIGAAIGPVPHEVRPVVVRWLRRLADQRLGRARKDAVHRVADEAPHPFNSRLKAAHHAAVAGICTDCHHHETAACHTASAAPGKEPS